MRIAYWHKTDKTEGGLLCVLVLPSRDTAPQVVDVLCDGQVWLTMAQAVTAYDGAIFTEV